MFEMRPYAKKNSSFYNQFRDMYEFEKKVFASPFGFFENGALEADLPGFEKKDIHLDINGDILTVSAERHSEHEEKDKKGKYVRCERSYGTYSRDFDVSGVDTEGIKAKYENGVLKLTKPKKADVLPEAKHLEIE